MVEKVEEIFSAAERTKGFSGRNNRRDNGAPWGRQKAVCLQQRRIARPHSGAKRVGGLPVPRVKEIFWEGACVVAAHVPPVYRLFIRDFVALSKKSRWRAAPTNLSVVRPPPHREISSPLESEDYDYSNF
jgi:hypothetical protein